MRDIISNLRASEIVIIDSRVLNWSEKRLITLTTVAKANRIVTNKQVIKCRQGKYHFIEQDYQDFVNS